jgi:hypothetical protein
MTLCRLQTAIFLIYMMALSACAEAPGAHDLPPTTDTQIMAGGDLVDDMMDLQRDPFVEQLDGTDDHRNLDTDVLLDHALNDTDLPSPEWEIELIAKLEQGIGGLALAADSAGTLHVSYATSSDRELIYTSNASGEWTTEIVGLSWCCTEDNTAIAVDNDDQVHLFNGASGIYHTFKLAGSTWENELVQAYTGNNNYAISATTHNEALHVAYRFYNLTHLVFNDGLWTSQLVDSETLTGEANSIKVDDNGHLHISYTPLSTFYQNAEGELVFNDNLLRYATNMSGSFSYEIIDETGRPSYSTSLALENGQNPHIAYYASGDGALRYAERDGEGWSITTIDSDNNAGFEVSLALTSEGERHVAYQAVDLGTLRYAHWDGVWNIESIDEQGLSGSLIALIVLPTGRAHIVYYDSESLELRHAFQGQ